MPWNAPLVDSPSAAGGSNLDRILEMLGSKGGQTLVNAAGAGISAYGANKESEANRAQTANQFNASMAQRQLENDQNNQLGRATSAASASPLGADQSFAQKQAISKAILGGARNSSVTPGDPRVAGAMGNMQGGLRLPDGGLDPAMLERLFGDAATQASIAQRSKMVGQINPRSPILDTAPMFGNSADGSENAFVTDMKSGNAQELARQDAESARQREIIQRAIDEDIKGENAQHSGSSFWKKLAKVGLMAAPFVAAPFTGGASLAAIGALSGAAKGALDGGGVKGALLGGAMGAIPTKLPIKGVK